MFEKRGATAAGWVALALLWPGISARAQNITAATSVETQILLRLAAPPAVSMPLWSKRDDAAAQYRRNPAVWTGTEVDLTGKAVWNSFAGAYGTTAISPRHVVYADHVKGLYPLGTVVRFVTNANAVVERRVVGSAKIGATDIDLSTLDTPLPASIHWYQVMPEHWFLRCSRSAVGIAGTLPCLILDANTQSVAVKDTAAFVPQGFFTRTPVDPIRRNFSRELHGGDSGSPMFVLVGRELVLDGIYHWTAGGSELSGCIKELNAAMQGSECHVTVCDLARFRAN